MFKVSKFNHRCNLANDIGMGGKLERKKEYWSVICPPPLHPPSYTYDVHY